MKALAKTTSQKSLLTLHLLSGALISAVAFVGTPILVFSLDPVMVQEPMAWIIVLALMAFFGLVGYLGSFRPYQVWRRLPEIQAETDGTYLYIHGKKEAKLPLSQLDGTYLDAHLPYIMTREFLVHLFSAHYGKVVIDTPNHGKYVLPFVADAREVPETIAELIRNTP